MDRQELRDQCKSLGIKYLPGHTNRQLQIKIKSFKMAKQTKAGNITPEQIQEWKNKYKKVYTLKVKVADNDIAIGFLRKPSRDHKAIALSLYAQNKILESGEFLRDNCWLGGDDRLKSNEDIADTAAVQASGIVKFLEAELGEA